MRPRPSGCTVTAETPGRAAGAAGRRDVVERGGVRALSLADAAAFRAGLRCSVFSVRSAHQGWRPSRGPARQRFSIQKSTRVAP
ncbi:hypothetical protein TR51_18910 [Kitasatospora griseola]|uniref:Uncharacterized protein n=1 Tax=Kitasatospora griseola TaxID=2064 RepID=A0A0D0P2H6_KITGR|nr:hypothetical protein TR51_18910 [Kitasatospora griseola]